jgi:hypothetical protein
MSEFIPGSGLLDAPADERGDPELNLARRAKEAGMSAKHYLKMRGDAVRLTGKVLRWDSSLYDQAFLALAGIIADVWGPIQ